LPLCGLRIAGGPITANISSKARGDGDVFPQAIISQFATLMSTMQLSNTWPWNTAALTLLFATRQTTPINLQLWSQYFSNHL
jgi:hypothetical protein